MSVSNGENLNDTTFNDAFVSKTSDSSVAAEVELADTDPVSGSTITNVQREHNSIASFLGKVINTAKDVLPSWATSNVGSPTDDVKTRVEALDANVSTTTANLAGKEDTANKGIANGYASLDANVLLAFAQMHRSEADDSATGANATLDAVATTVVRLTNASLTSVDMIPAGDGGRQFVLVNRTTVSIDINNDTGATAAQRILTGTGATLALADNAALIFEYDSTTTRWQIVGGSGGGAAGANDTLSNLTSPTAINQQLDFAGSNSVRVPNDVYYLGAFGGGSRTLIKVDAAGRIRAGQSGVDFRFDADIEPVTDGTKECGTTALRWLNVSSDQFEGFGMVFASQTMPSGIGSVAAIGSTGTIDVGLFTSSNADADAVKTCDVFIDTGNKSNAGSSGDTGTLFYKTGDAAGSGNSGPIVLDSGTSGSGTRGSINILGPSLDGSTVNDAWVLQNTTTGAGAWVAPAAAANKNIAAFSSTATAGSTDDIIELSGASFTLTLPTAVGADGKVFEILHLGTSLSQVYTIDGDGAQTIGGNTTFLMHTNRQKLRIHSDGANWQILDSYTETAWSDGGPLTIGATTTGPTKGTVGIDTAYWKRIGQDMLVNYTYTQTAGSAAGSGDYLFQIPNSSNVAIDTGIISAYSTVEGSGSNFNLSNRVGDMTGFDSAQGNIEGGVVVYDSDNVRFFVGYSPHNVSRRLAVIGSGVGSLATTTITYTANFRLPIDGWEN